MRVRADLAGAGNRHRVQETSVLEAEEQEEQQRHKLQHKGQGGRCCSSPSASEEGAQGGRGRGTENELAGRLCLRRCVEPAR